MSILDKIKGKKTEDNKTAKPKKAAVLTTDKAVKKTAPVKNTDPKTLKDAKHYPHSHKILLRPLVTEKINMLSMHNQYAFEVAQGANKIEIKKAVKSVYNVAVTNVNIIKIKGKSVQYGRRMGHTKAWKKAIITLKQGDKIEIYEGV